MSWSISDDEIHFQAPANLAKLMGSVWKPIGQMQWSLPASRMNARWLVELGLAGQDLVDALKPPEDEIVTDARLYPDQRRAASRLVLARHGAMLVMPPGKGKTPTAIVAADFAVPDDPIVVVTLPSLVDNWRREIETWAKKDSKWTDQVYVVREKITENEVIKMINVRWLIVSWDRVVNDPTLWETKNKWPLWVIDENVLAKSRAAQRKLVFSGGTVKKNGVVTKRFDGLRKHVQRFFMLSASPSTRYSDDLWACANILWPKAFRSYWRVAERYCTIEETPWSRKVTGDKPGMNFLEDNDDIIVQADPPMNIPEYIFEPRHDVVLLPSQRAAFDQMTRDFIAELGDGRQVIANNEVAKLVRLQQIVSYWDGESAKAEAAVAIMQRTEPPYLLWTHWVDGARYLTSEIVSAGFSVAHVEGATKNKDDLIEAYKRGDIQALVMSLGVGKFGHTLINTNTEIRVDKTWNADDYFQSFHRVRRHGLDHRPRLFSIHAVGTTDDLIDLNQEGKLTSISKLTRSDLAALLKGLGR